MAVDQKPHFRDRGRYNGRGRATSTPASSIRVSRTRSRSSSDDPAQVPARSFGSVQNPRTSSGESLFCELLGYAYTRCARQHSTERRWRSLLIGWLRAAGTQTQPCTSRSRTRFATLLQARPCQTRVGTAHTLGTVIDGSPFLRRGVPCHTTARPSATSRTDRCELDERTVGNTRGS